MSDIDYAAGLREAYNALPTYAQMEAQSLANAQARLQNQTGAFTLDRARQQAADDDAFRLSVSQLSSSARAPDYANLLLRHPAHAEQIKSAWGMQSAELQRQQLSTMSQAWSAINNGKPELAVALLRRSQDALKADGLPEDPEDAAYIKDIESGDPQRLAGVRNTLGVVLASVAGPEHFGSTLNALKAQNEGYTLNSGDVRYDAQNRPVAAAPYRPEVVHVRDGGGGERVYSYQPGTVLGGGPGGLQPLGYGGGDPASGGPAPGPAGGTRGIRNNNPGNLEASAFTRSQPGYVGSDGRFARFATPEDGVRAHEALLNRAYFGRGVNTINGIVRKYAPAADGNDVDAYATFLAKKVGVSPSEPITDPAQRAKLAAAMRNYESRYQKAEPAALTLIASGAPKPGWRVLTPAEVAKQPGLDPTRAYQQNGDGRIVPIGGKPKSTSAPNRAATLAGVMAPIFQKVVEGRTLTAGEQQALTLYRSRGSRAGRPGAAPGAGAPLGTQANPVAVKGPADAAKLASGTWIRTPDGRVGQRK